MSSKKEECMVCERTLRLRSFVKNNLLNQKICKRCDKKIGHNKYYVDEPKVNKRFWSRKTTDRQILFNNYTNQGMSPEQARKRVNVHMKSMRTLYKHKKQKIRATQIEDIKNKLVGKKFKESLKNLK